MRLKRYILVLFLLFSSLGVSLFAQTNHEEFRGLDRWAFKTNALGWVATVPNFTAEFDLSSHYYRHCTIGLGVLYNWETYQTHPSYTKFNLLTVRPEFRYWLGTKELNRNRDVEYKGSYYIGFYLSGGTYTMKLSEIGRQGYHTGMGLSFGYAMPLHEYRTGAVDIEFGLNLGVEAVTVDAFVLNDMINAYEALPDMSRKFGLLPYPIVSDISVTFSWRKTSIKHRHITRYENTREYRKMERENRKNR